MRISSFEVRNYKSFSDSGMKLKLAPGFNLIVGQNNAGKTALLEAMSLTFQAKPHQSLSSKPRETAPLNPESRAVVEVTVSGTELREIFYDWDGIFYLPRPVEGIRDWPQDPNLILERMFDCTEINFLFEFINNSGTFINRLARFPSHGLYRPFRSGGGFQYYSVKVNRDSATFSFGDTSSAAESCFEMGIAERFRKRIYIFSAERTNICECNQGTNMMLLPDARNLPEVLDVLHGNASPIFRKLNEYLREIFPSIYEIAVRPMPQNRVQIVVWTGSPKEWRSDLAIPLSECGSGVGQALAMLYVAINTNTPSIIIIDEPNTFLHPAASRKLIEILKRISANKHQYIIATHSAEIIKIANPNTLTLVRLDKNSSALDCLDVNGIDDRQKVLIEVGAKLSDVFGADNILWVEGFTEEQCFQRILEKTANSSILAGTSIVGVIHTGDFFRKKDKRLILHIYEKLSKGGALLPQVIRFLFDREKLTPQEILDLEKESNNIIRFIPRRTYENYLIHLGALVAIMNDLPTFKEGKISEEKISEWLIRNGGKSKYIDNPSKEIEPTDQEWLRKVNGAQLLSDMFDELSSNREQYIKTEHSILLTDWLLENAPETLSELIEFLLQVLRKEEGV